MRIRIFPDVVMALMGEGLRFRQLLGWVHTFSLPLQVSERSALRAARVLF